MKEDEFAFIGEKIADVLDDITNAQKIAAIAEEIKALGRAFLTYDRSTF
jgi:glycine hydroxymethyltransferase